MPAPAEVEAETRAWVDEAVVGLNLCPFARPVLSQDRLRLVVTPAADAEALLEALVAELRRLVGTPAERLETTLLVHPGFGHEFRVFNDFLDIADAALRALGLHGTVQIASFHPDYRFEGTAAGDVENATNRSPFPTLHLLREASIERAVASMADPSVIYRRNQQTMRTLGADGWAALRARCRARAGAAAAGHEADATTAPPPATDMRGG